MTLADIKKAVSELKPHQRRAFNRHMQTHAPRALFLAQNAPEPSCEIESAKKKRKRVDKIIADLEKLPPSEQARYKIR